MLIKFIMPPCKPVTSAFYSPDLQQSACIEMLKIIIKNFKVAKRDDDSIFASK